MTFDGHHVWFATGDKLNALDPESGETVRSIDVAAHAGTAFDGEHLFQIAEDCIQKIDPKTGRVLSTIPAPGNGGDSGLAWAEGTLWVGQHRGRKIHQHRSRDGGHPAHDRVTVSLPASPGSMATCGTAPGKATTAMSGASIRKRARCWSGSTCRPAWACRGLRPMAATVSSAAEAQAARSEPSAGRSGRRPPTAAPEANNPRSLYVPRIVRNSRAPCRLVAASRAYADATRTP